MLLTRLFSVLALFGSTIFGSGFRYDEENKEVGRWFKKNTRYWNRPCVRVTQNYVAERINNIVTEEFKAGDHLLWDCPNAKINPHRHYYVMRRGKSCTKKFRVSNEDFDRCFERYNEEWLGHEVANLVFEGINKIKITKAMFNDDFPSINGERYAWKTYNDRKPTQHVRKATENHALFRELPWWSTFPITLTRHKAESYNPNSKWHNFWFGGHCGGTYFESAQDKNGGKWRLYIIWEPCNSQETGYKDFGLVLDYIPEHAPLRWVLYDVWNQMASARFRLAPKNLKWEGDTANTHWQLEHRHFPAVVKKPYRDLEPGQQVTVKEKIYSQKGQLHSVKLMRGKQIPITLGHWREHFKELTEYPNEIDEKQHAFIGLQLQRSSTVSKVEKTEIQRNKFKTIFKPGMRIISTNWTVGRYGKNWVGTLKSQAHRDWTKKRRRWFVNWEYRLKGKKKIAIPEKKRLDRISQKNFEHYSTVKEYARTLLS